MNKPIFKAGQRFEYEVECAQNIEITILAVYPAGTENANKDSNFYLIDSTNSGQDVQSELTILQDLDLLKYPELLPSKVRKILETYSEVDNYVGLNTLLSVLKPLGYAFDYYLDAVPYNLRKI